MADVRTGLPNDGSVISAVIDDLAGNVAALTERIADRLEVEQVGSADGGGHGPASPTMTRWLLHSLRALAVDRQPDTQPMEALVFEQRSRGSSSAAVQLAVRVGTDELWTAFVESVQRLELDPGQALARGGTLVRQLAEVSISAVAAADVLVRTERTDPAAGLIRALTSPGPFGDEVARLAALAGIRGRGSLLAAAVATPGGRPQVDLRHAVAAHGGAWVVLTEHADDDLDRAEGALAVRLRELNPEARVGVGLSHAGFEGAARSIDEAVRSLRAARRWGDVELRYRHRWMATMAVDMEDDLRDVLAPLVSVLEEDADLAETARAYLEADGSLTVVGEQLHLHPNTVRYRLQQIGNRSGMDVRTLMGGWSLYVALTLALERLDPGRAPRP